MNRFYLLSLVTILTQATASASPNEPNCDPVPVCADFEEVRVEQAANPQPEIPNWENETDIARSGSWDGVVPISYIVDLKFSNRTHYTGSVDITFLLLANPFTRLMINHGALNPSVDYKGITIKRLCTKPRSPPDRQVRASLPNTRCIKKATFLEANETLILDLNEVDFDVGRAYRYQISFPFFEGRSEFEGGGAKGLMEATSNYDDDTGPGFSASTTIFQMRYARTVFPCFDHPALKARFKLCIETPNHIDVASNTLQLGRQMPVDGSRKKVCFQQTLRIPTYVFTFALMENYTTESVEVSKWGPTIQIYAPNGTMKLFRWMFDEAVPVVQYMERITKFKFPLRRLGFVVAYPSPFWGVENFGLVSVDGGFMQAPSSTETAYAILYHEIVHQWLGDLVTISEWREICLQEGLTTYFEWKISAERRNISIDKKAHQASKKDDSQDYYEPYGLREYKKTQDIVSWCYGRPAVFFHSVARRYGFEALERFLESLIRKKRYGTADIRLWDKTLNEVTTAKSQDMKGYIEGWFLGPGPQYLLISKIPDTDCIIINQQYYGPSKKSVPDTSPRLMPLDVEIFENATSKSVFPIFVKSLETKVCDVSKPIFVVDPAGATVTRKVYTSDMYRNVLQFQNENPEALTNRQLDTFVDHFCKALLNDILPLPQEPKGTSASEWLEVYSLVKNSTILSKSSICWCCMSNKEENRKIRTCLRSWNGYCSELRLSHFVGYNYNFTRDDVWG